MTNEAEKKPLQQPLVSDSLPSIDPLDDEDSEIHKIGREIAEMSDEEFEANCKAISDMLSKSKSKSKGNDANRLLPAAALWWRNLTAKQKAYLWDKYYDNHEITNERINERYEYDKRLSAEHAIDPNRF